jgi:hypothetical protein
MMRNACCLLRRLGLRRLEKKKVRDLKSLKARQMSYSEQTPEQLQALLLQVAAARCFIS